MKSLTSEDRKLIVITVAATVAANLITVVVVALAIIIARDFRPQPGTPKSYFRTDTSYCHTCNDNPNRF